MVELTLQSYVAAIEAQLAGGAADEATYHSRHILSQYPRYTPAFRLLGRALFLKGQLPEAEAAFRRVLNVEPSDVTAHLGLSEIYDHRRRGEEAIWHAERAMETEITNVTITDQLRVLYRRYRGEEQPRMSLTAVALTRQALQNHDYTQAIATLRDALERQPERADLRLLLAEALWESGDHVAAGETARDVAETLPDCFTANAILTRLWLEVGRPSDAQPYLNRLEALDPYAAVALASGKAVEADAFMIEPLDYQRSAQSEVARATPDWLTGIAPAESIESPAMEWTSRMLASQQEHEATEQIPSEPEAVTQVVPAASVLPWWVTDEQEQIADEPVPPAPGLSPEPTLELPAGFDFSEPVVETAAEDLFPDLDALFADTPADPDEAFAAPFSFEEPAQEAPAPVTETNPLPPLDSIAARPMPPAEDAMAWLRETGVELVDDEAPAFSLETGSEFPEAAPEDHADPMAWLSSYDSILTETPAPPQEEAANAGVTMVFESGWEADFMASAEGHAERQPAAPDAVPEPEAAAVETTTSPLRGLTSRLGDPAITPVVPAVPEPTADEPVLEGWFAGFEAPPSAAVADAPSPEWLTDLGVVMTNEPNSTAGVPDDHEEILPHEPLEADAAAQPDWMAELGTAASGAEAEIPEWLLESAPENLGTSAEAEAAPSEALNDVMPEWLMESNPEAITDLAGEAAPVAAPGEEEFDWLDTLNQSVELEPVAAVDEAVIAAQADVPDWLDALEADALATIDAHQTGIEAVAAPSDEVLPFDETEWPSAQAETVEAFEPEAEAATFAEAEPVVEAEAVAEAVAEAEPLADATMTLAGESEPELTAADWGEPEQADLARIAPPTVMAADFTPAPQAEADADDWFADPALAADVMVPAEASLTEPASGDWLEDAALHVTAPALSLEAEELPVDVAAEAESWPEIVQDEVDVEAWPVEPLFEGETSAGSDTAPWLIGSDLEGSAEEVSSEVQGPGVEAAGAAALGALAFATLNEPEGETASGEPALVNTEDDWLAAEWPEDAETGALIEQDELDALPDVEIAEETAIAPAANAPDWLNAMVPGLDLDYEVAGEEPVEGVLEEDERNALDETLGAATEYGWVIDLVEQEQAETETAPAEIAVEGAAEAPRFVFQRLPAWFRQATGADSEDDFADWPNDDSSLQAWQN